VTGTEPKSAADLLRNLIEALNKSEFWDPKLSAAYKEAKQFLDGQQEPAIEAVPQASSKKSVVTIIMPEGQD